MRMGYNYKTKVSFWVREERIEMEKNKYLGNVLDNAGDKAKYDTQVKKILSDKNILAWILKHSVTEFKEDSIETIISCIKGEPEVAVVPIYPGSKRTEAILGAAVEDSVPNEGKITYDIRFHVVTAAEERIKILINVEAQKKYYPGYDLVTRAIFFCSRMLSAQLDTEFTANNYDNIKKVCSIWICMDTPKYAENTITEYAIEQKKMFGNFSGKARYDLLSAVMVCIGKTSETCDDAPLHKLLATVLSEEMPVKEKTKILEEEYNIHTKQVEEVLNTMCNLSDRVEEKGIEKGIEKGRNETIILSVRNLMDSLDLSLEKACEALKIPIEEYYRILK